MTLKARRGLAFPGPYLARAVEGHLPAALYPEHVRGGITRRRVEEHVVQGARRAQGVGRRVLQQDQPVYRRPRRVCACLKGTFLEVPGILVRHLLARPVVQLHRSRWSLGVQGLKCRGWGEGVSSA